MATTSRAPEPPKSSHLEPKAMTVSSAPSITSGFEGKTGLAQDRAGEYDARMDDFDRDDVEPFAPLASPAMTSTPRNAEAARLNMATRMRPLLLGLSLDDDEQGMLAGNGGKEEGDEVDITGKGYPEEISIDLDEGEVSDTSSVSAPDDSEQTDETRVPKF